MNRPRSFEKRLESWLEEGPASAPPDLLAEVLDSVPHDKSRRRRGGARRLQMLSSLARFGAAVAAILVIGVVGISLLESKFPGVGGPGTTATPIVTDRPGTTDKPIVTNLPSAAATDTFCGPDVLTARILSWEGAAGHRIATVELKNTGPVACQTGAFDRPQLVGGDGTVLIDGIVDSSLQLRTLAAGQTVSTLVQDGDYCGATPVAPVTVAFVLSSGAGRVVAAPVSSTDTEGVPPCNSTIGSAGTIEMHNWAP
jgi:hypothetical protein